MPGFSDPRLADFLSHLEIEGVSRNTRLAYGRDIGGFLSWLGGKKPLALVEREDLRAFLAEKSQNRAPASQARLSSSLRGFFLFLFKRGEVARNPAEKLRSPKVPKQAPATMDENETERLLSHHFPQTPRGLRDRAMLEVLYGSGLRASELAGLALEDLNLEEGFLRVRGKGKKDRLVPLTEAARQALADYARRGRPRFLPKSNAFFVGKGGKGLSRQMVWRCVCQAATAAGLGRLYPHALRHAFATHLIEHGADLRAVQMLLGHASITTTEIYTRISKKRLAELMAAHHPRG
mgnify:CR=1 FL=1